MSCASIGTIETAERRFRLGKSGDVRLQYCSRIRDTGTKYWHYPDCSMLILLFVLLVGCFVELSAKIPVVDLGKPYSCQRHELLYPQIDLDLQPWAAGIDEEANAAALHVYCSRHKGHVCLRIRNGTLLAMMPTQPDFLLYLEQHSPQTSGTWL